MLKDKKIIVGVCGGIAAYKTVALVRLLTKEGADVRIVMTPSAREFVGPVTFAGITHHEVWDSFYTRENTSWNNHVELGLWADLMLIAPITADTLAAMAHGSCNKLLLAVYLSARCPVMVAPAMDLDMYSHPATQRNLQTILEDGVHIIDPVNGALASGLEGKGRMEEPENIFLRVKNFFDQPIIKGDLMDKKILITAGPTQEAIDPVRFISNHSSGKMGIALADDMASRGAEVHLVLGPTHLRPQSADIQVYTVKNAREMYDKCMALFPDCNGAICTAAVADYRPEKTSNSKIKKEKQDLEIKLVRNPDILYDLGKLKTKQQFLVGFALETDSPIENGRSKLEKKNLDFIVINSPSAKGSGFQFDTNEISILDKDNKLKNYQLKSKVEVARDIIDFLVSGLVQKVS